MAAGDLTILNDAKNWLGIPLTDTANDALLANIITSASAFLINWFNRQILTATYTEKYNGNGKQFLQVRNWPITAISSLSSNGIAIVPSPDGILDGYIFDDTLATVYLLGPLYFNKGIRNIFITYTAGYATVPVDIAQACNELVGAKFKRRQRIGITSQQIGGQQTVSYSPNDLSPDTKAMLQNYRNVIPA